MAPKKRSKEKKKKTVSHKAHHDPHKHLPSHTKWHKHNNHVARHVKANRTTAHYRAHYRNGGARAGPGLMGPPILANPGYNGNPAALNAPGDGASYPVPNFPQRVAASLDDHKGVLDRVAGVLDGVGNVATSAGNAITNTAVQYALIKNSGIFGREADPTAHLEQQLAGHREELDQLRMQHRDATQRMYQMQTDRYHEARRAGQPPEFRVPGAGAPRSGNGSIIGSESSAPTPSFHREGSAPSYGGRTVVMDAADAAQAPGAGHIADLLAGGANIQGASRAAALDALDTELEQILPQPMQTAPSQAGPPASYLRAMDNYGPMRGGSDGSSVSAKSSRVRAGSVGSWADQELQASGAGHITNGVGRMGLNVMGFRVDSSAVKRLADFHEGEIAEAGRGVRVSHAAEHGRQHRRYKIERKRKEKEVQMHHLR